MTTGDMTSCIRHAARSRFFVLYEDFLILTGWNYTDASALRVLETKTNDRIAQVRETRGAEPKQSDLWITLLWNDYDERSLHLYDGRSYQSSLPRLEKLGFVQSRYVKLDDLGQLMRDERTHALLIYDTYKAAQCDRAHPGTIVKQYLYLCEVVNAAIDNLGKGNPPPPPPAPRPPRPGAQEPGDDAPSGANDPAPDTAGDKGPSSQEEDEAIAREGNPRTPANRSSSGSSIVADGIEKLLEGSANSPGNGGGTVGNFAATPCQISETSLENTVRPVGKDSNNKNQMQESDARIDEESAAGAADGAPDGAETIFFEKKFLGDGEDAERLWSREAILNLAAVYLPALAANRRQKQLQEDAFNWDQAAKRVFESSALHSLASDEARINHLVRLFLYMTTPSSPCSWQRFMRQRHPDAPVRLWHVANNAISMSMEMEQFDWWPIDTGQGDPFLHSHSHEQREADRERETEELAALGMCEVEADDLMAVISGRCPDWGVRKRRLLIDEDRWRVEFSADRQKAAYVYRRQDWSEGWQRDPENCWVAFRRRLGENAA